MNYYNSLKKTKSYSILGDETIAGITMPLSGGQLNMVVGTEE